MPKPPPWPPAGGAQRYRTERLAYLAAEPWIRRWSSPVWLRIVTLGIFDPYVANSTSSSTRKDFGNTRVGRFAMRCDKLARDLTPEDVAALKDSGALPPWFLERLRNDTSL